MASSQRLDSKRILDVPYIFRRGGQIFEYDYYIMLSILPAKCSSEADLNFNGLNFVWTLYRNFIVSINLIGRVDIWQMITLDMTAFGRC